MTRTPTTGTGGVGDGRPGTLATYFERDPRRERRARMGAGQTHHFALAVADEKTQLDFRDRLLTAGYHVSPVMDRTYFRSIYSNDRGPCRPVTLASSGRCARLLAGPACHSC